MKDCLHTTKLGYVYQEVDVPWLEDKPTRHLRRAIAMSFGGGATLAAETSKKTKFPVVFDSSVSTMVKRPKKSRNEKEKEEEEEVLVIEGIEFERELV